MLTTAAGTAVIARKFIHRDGWAVSLTYHFEAGEHTIGMTNGGGAFTGGMWGFADIAVAREVWARLARQIRSEGFAAQK